MPSKRVCPVPGCPAIIDRGQRKCARHLAEYEAERNQRRRGQYDRKHKEASRSARAEAARERRPCPMCGQPMTDPSQMHYDHGVPLAVDPKARATRVVCAPCNSSAGGRLAHGLPPKPRPATRQLCMGCGHTEPCDCTGCPCARRDGRDARPPGG